MSASFVSSKDVESFFPSRRESGTRINKRGKRNYICTGNKQDGYTCEGMGSHFWRHSKKNIARRPGLLHPLAIRTYLVDQHDNSDIRKWDCSRGCKAKVNRSSSTDQRLVPRNGDVHFWKLVIAGVSWLGQLAQQRTEYGLANANDYVRTWQPQGHPPTELSRIFKKAWNDTCIGNPTIFCQKNRSPVFRILLSVLQHSLARLQRKPWNRQASLEYLKRNAEANNMPNCRTRLDLLSIYIIGIGLKTLMQINLAHWNDFN